MKLYAYTTEQQHNNKAIVGSRFDHGAKFAANVYDETIDNNLLQYGAHLDTANARRHMATQKPKT